MINMEKIALKENFSLKGISRSHKINLKRL